MCEKNHVSLRSEGIYSSEDQQIFKLKIFYIKEKRKKGRMVLQDQQSSTNKGYDLQN